MDNLHSSDPEILQKNNISPEDPGYQATLKVTDHSGILALQLSFDPNTESRLREEISLFADDKALITFTITATNLRSLERGTMMFKGCVAPEHCMPLNFYIAPDVHYCFQVDMFKYSSHFANFLHFLRKELVHSTNGDPNPNPALSLRPFLHYGSNGISFPAAGNTKEHVNTKSVEGQHQVQGVSKFSVQGQLNQIEGPLGPIKQPSYLADLSVSITDLRRVTIVLKFNSETVVKLRDEMSGFTGDYALLKFVLKVTNIRTRRVTTRLFKGSVLPVHCMPFDYPLKLGCKYLFEVEVQRFSCQDGQFVSVLETRVKHREVLNQLELWQLLHRATFFNVSRSTENLEVHFAYRNKPPPYFDAILQRQNGIMNVYAKDRNGDPGCPLNEQVYGLFFGVRINPNTKELPSESYFGSRRIIIPITKMVKETTKLYFADFYCHKNVHHITLVTTKPGSKVDLFCQKFLLELPMDNNPFFYRVSDTDGSRFYCSREPRVEILHTEDIDLKKEYVQWATVTPLGMGSSSRTGIPKRPDCEICNLYLQDQLDHTF